MRPAQRDSLTGHVFASLCLLRQFSNCFAMSAAFPIEGRRDFIARHFYAQRDSLAGHFLRPDIPF